MKPTLDRMTDMVIASLSGDAKAFYEKEFGFFNEVTSISGKLRPFIKKTKPEKKVKSYTSKGDLITEPYVGEDR
jgi:phosphatidylinositol 4-kinase A